MLKIKTVVIILKILPLILYLRLVAKQVNSVEGTKKLVQMSHLFWHFSEELEC